MNDESAETEAAGLAATGASVTKVMRRDETAVTLDGRTFDLASDVGCNAFAKALAGKHGLSEETAGQMGKILFATEDGGRDELARIAIIWATAESGKTIPSRLVLSGHSTGSDVHGNGDALKFQRLFELANLLPNAALQIEDIHFSGCYTAGEVINGAVLKGSFPNLKTVWGYPASAPTAPVGQLKQWEALTRGRASGDAARGLPGVTTWSTDAGIRERGVSVDTLRAEVTRADQRYVEHFSGDLPIHYDREGLANNDYAIYRQLASRPELSEQERRVYRERADVLFRVRFYEQSVRGEFERSHGREVTAGFRALGLAAPDFATLSRKEALEAFVRFEAALHKANPAPAEAVLAADLLGALARLDSTVIKDTWCR